MLFSFLFVKLILRIGKYIGNEDSEIFNF